VHLVVMTMTSPYIYENHHILPYAIISQTSTVNPYQKIIKKKSNNKPSIDIASLMQDGYVIHDEHGIGRFVELTTMGYQQQRHDCLKIAYANDDVLYVPVENSNCLHHYAHADNESVVLDSLGSSAWQRRKASLKRKILLMATQLAEIAAKRSLVKVAVMELNQQYQDFCDKFDFVETPDQLTAIEDIEYDLASDDETTPVERLICGDVGFGKTEVAMRAAAIAISNGFQVAIIAPTTLLARQHYYTLQQRFAHDNGVKIAHFSRLVSMRARQEIKQQLAVGDVNIVVGTHALLNNSIMFDNLGVIILDEEHHFGVKQKEAIKQMAQNCHLYSLSATPIPRTLNMAMGGLRELSMITTPPLARSPIKTHISPFQDDIIINAINDEVARGGQIYYVCPHISDISSIENFLQERLPHVSYITAHGQLTSANLERCIDLFAADKVKVLISTPIVESGMDIAGANTLIVHNAQHFGLAQLYQLRGRVGRRSHQGYAYLTVPPDYTLSDNARKRFEALQQLSYLGAGFELAKRDMEIRGAGNLLGKEQSGHIKEVGMELYQDMLSEAMLTVKHAQNPNDNGDDKPTEQNYTPQINTPLPVFIPEEYIPQDNVRLAIYRRSASITNKAEASNFAKELVNRFGKRPDSVNYLLHIINLKILCLEARVAKLDITMGGVGFNFHNNTPRSPDHILAYVKRNHKQLTIKSDMRLIYKNNWRNINACIKDVKTVLNDIISMC
jgi:transcription-repair coupling factor (superfamily II helicase)